MPGNVTRGSILSGGVKYAKGPLYLALAHEMHNDYFGATRNLPTALSNTIGGTGAAKTGTLGPGVNSTDMATRVTAQYRFTPRTRAEVDFAVTRLEETSAVGRFESYRHNSWLVTLQDQGIPVLTAQVAYGHADEGSCTRVSGTACNTAGLDSQDVEPRRLLRNVKAHRLPANDLRLSAAYQSMQSSAVIASSAT